MPKFEHVCLMSIPAIHWAGADIARAAYLVNRFLYFCVSFCDCVSQSEVSLICHQRTRRDMKLLLVSDVLAWLLAFR